MLDRNGRRLRPASVRLARRCYNRGRFADVAKPADAPDLGSGFRKEVEVQVLSSAPMEALLEQDSFGHGDARVGAIGVTLERAATR